MENNINLICSICEKQLKLSNGGYLFTYNTEYKNNHKNNNIDLDNLLLIQNYLLIAYFIKKILSIVSNATKTFVSCVYKFQ